jgi:ubiquinone/menaquinone biosynthesis C-methylase UbiE
MLTRQQIGTMTAATERDDASYLDFVEGIKVFIASELDPVVWKRAEESFKEFERKTGRKAQGIDDAKHCLDHVPVVASRNRLMRTSQEMMWNGITETYRKRESKLLADLDQADRSGPGSLEYDANFQYPNYFKVDIHLQPGGYWADPLAGYVYHYGTKIFMQGANDYDDSHRYLVNKVPTPKDGRVNRILDLGCSIGQSTTAFKERFPNAQVWGIDAGGPMVRYAHKRAVDMSMDVHLAQRLAEDTKFPENYFDIVYAFILFHEIPIRVAEQVIREAHRVLRKGGLFVIEDFANSKDFTSPLQPYLRSFDAHDNCEPFSSAFVYCDFPSALQRLFQKVDESSTVMSYQNINAVALSTRVCEK